MTLPLASGPRLASQAHEQRFQQGIICSFITESPEDYETDRLAEPFGSPYDPTVPRATRASATNGHAFPPTPKPVQRPISDLFLPESNVLKFCHGYLAQQFGAHRPVVEQVGLIGVLSGLPPIVADNQRAYNHPHYSPSYPSKLSPLNPSTIACDHRPPHDANPSSHGSKAPYAPTTEQLLKGVYVPTWDQLDVASRQIQELYALRALLGPHGHRLRTHVPVLPNIPSEEHRIWGGPVPLVSGNIQAKNNWDVLGDFNWDCTSARSDEAHWQALESPLVSPLYLDESRIPTPESVQREPLVESVIHYRDLLSDEESDDGSVQCQLDPGEAPLDAVVEAWDNLDDVVIQVRARSNTFVYPSKLDFVPTYGTDNDPVVNQQSLRNNGFINYWEFLYRSLDELTSMEPLTHRMTIALGRAVEEVNCELDKVEGFAAKLWEKECQAKERKRFWRNVFASEYDDDEWR